MSGPLDSLRVVDGTSTVAGSILTMLLADYGGEVIKVEPAAGDPTRLLPGFAAWGRGKRSAVLAEGIAGQEALVGLLAGADVLVESAGDLLLERLSIDPARLASIQPMLVHCVVSGGEGSSDGDRATQDDLLVATRLGLTADGDKQTALGWLMPSYSAAAVAANAVLAALYARHHTGAGERLDVSMTDGVLAASAMNAWWSARDIYPFGRPGTRNRSAITKNRRLILGMFECGDGLYLQFHTGSPGGFTRALHALGLDEVVPASQSRMETSESLTDEEEERLWTEVRRVLLTETRDHWIGVFGQADVCCQPVYRPDEVFDDEQARHNELIIRVSDPILGPLEQIGPAARFSGTPAKISGPAPVLGEHTGSADWVSSAPGWAAALSSVSETGGTRAHPLAGVRIVDLGMYFAGPFASRLLSDLGANVIKVEPPVGDSMRPMPTVFEAAQRGKRGLVLDLKQPAAQDVFRRLVLQADVVHHNFRPGIAEKLGVDYDSLRAVKPDLIYCFSPGFGSSGPKSLQQSFAPVTGGLSGLYYRAGGVGNPPRQAGNEDFFNAVLGASAILMALLHRQRTGEGQYIESPQINSALFLSTDVSRDANGLLHGASFLNGEQTGWSATNCLYPTKDSWIAIAGQSDEAFRRLCTAVGFAELCADSRLSSATKRALNDEWLTKTLSDTFAARTTVEWSRLLEAAGVASAEARGSSFLTEVFEQGGWWSQSGHVVDQQHDEYGHIREIGQFMHFAELSQPRRGPAPCLGEHTVEILAELGYSPGDTDALAATDAVRSLR